MRPVECAQRDRIGVDRIMWGADYPHLEGTAPYTREALRHTFSGVDPAETAAMLGLNAAAVYGFDLGALAPLAETHWPHGGRGGHPAGLGAGGRQQHRLRARPHPDLVREGPSCDPYLIISADCHAELPTERYRSYVDPEYREDFEAYLVEKEEQSRLGGFMDEAFAEQWFDENGEGIAGGWDVARRDKELDGDGVAGEVIFPDADAVTGVAGAPFGAGLGQSGDLDPGRAMAGARAHNRWLAELCAHSPERRAGVAVVPILADIDAAVAEVTRAAEAACGAVS